MTLMEFVEQIFTFAFLIIYYIDRARSLNPALIFYFYSLKTHQYFCKFLQSELHFSRKLWPFAFRILRIYKNLVISTFKNVSRYIYLIKHKCRLSVYVFGSIYLKAELTHHHSPMIINKPEYLLDIYRQWRLNILKSLFLPNQKIFTKSIIKCFW